MVSSKTCFDISGESLLILFNSDILKISVHRQFASETILLAKRTKHSYVAAEEKEKISY